MEILGVVDSGVVAALISSVALVSLVDAIASGGWEMDEKKSERVSRFVQAHAVPGNDVRSAAFEGFRKSKTPVI